MENIFTVSQPFLIYARILGLFPMCADGPARKGFFKVKWHSVVVTVCSMFVLLYATVQNFSHYYFFNVYASDITTKAWDILKNAELCSYFLLLGYQICKRKQVVEFLRLIYQIDEEVRNLIYKNILMKQLLRALSFYSNFTFIQVFQCTFKHSSCLLFEHIFN